MYHAGITENRQMRLPDIAVLDVSLASMRSTVCDWLDYQTE